MPAGSRLASRAERGWCAPGRQHGLGHAHARARACAWAGRERKGLGGLRGLSWGTGMCWALQGAAVWESTKPGLGWRRRWGHSGHMSGTLGPEQAGQRWLAGSVGLCQPWGPCVPTLGTLCHVRTL